MNNEHLARVFDTCGRPWRPCIESVYGAHLDSFLVELSRAWAPEYANYDFLIYQKRHREPLPDFQKRGDNVVLVYLSDEYGTIPAQLCGQFHAILKSYWPLERPLKNIIPFPHGYGNCITELSLIPFSERTVDCFFSGYFNYNRLELFRAFSAYRWLPPFPLKSTFSKRAYWHLLSRTGLYQPGWREAVNKTKIYFTPSFGAGLSRKEYASHMANSRIVLCPRGHVSAESFRLFEAASMGCVIVSDPLPRSHWYKDAPYITCRDWLNVRGIIDELGKDADRLYQLHRDTLNWWQTRLSDRPAAEFVARCLQEVKTEVSR